MLISSSPLYLNCQGLWFDPSFFFHFKCTLLTTKWCISPPQLIFNQLRRALNLVKAQVTKLNFTPWTSFLGPMAMIERPRKRKTSFPLAEMEGF